ncbi:hypothetical protein [Vibrio atypicus]|uniref:hypothetical protein n=1 Tax=Vibrio atypicus TaxID=558271 RepID=UPI003735D689
MRIVLLSTVLLLSTPVFANQGVEAQLYTNLNSAIVSLGDKIKECEEGAKSNNPDATTIKLVRENLEQLAPLLSHVNDLAEERCSLNERKELAYQILLAKNNSKRQSTLELIQSVEQLTFEQDVEMKNRFKALSSIVKKQLLQNPFFSKPFNVLELYESAIQM